MNADTLALARMDDDGWGCAITTEPVLRYVAHFTPEAWVNKYAVEADAEGPQEWDATTYALQHLEYLASVGRRRRERLDDPDGVLDNDDVFRDDPDAPSWVREWSGPFTIRIRTEGA